MNPTQKAFRKVETHPMKTEDVNSSLQENPINPKTLQESLVLGKAKERMTCFPTERNDNHLFNSSKRNVYLTRNLEHNTKEKRKFKKFS